MGKTALIVDDSKSARHVLKRMLEAHALTVDTAESAEMALDYLNDHRPDVIFMDHMMPGMDGFEAVTAIKNNPDTATIPIMMYTSQKGEVYVGQARALGAVGVLPKEVEPVEVSKVLASLRVIDEASGANGRTGGMHPTPAQTAELDQMDRNIRLLIEDLFDQQRAIIRADMQDSYHSIASRVAAEIRPRSAEEEIVGLRLARKTVLTWKIVTALVSIVALGLAVLLWDRQQELHEITGAYNQLDSELRQRAVETEQGSANVERRIESYQRSLDSTYAATLRAIEWGVNKSATYGYGEIPLGDSQLAVFDPLLRQLIDIGFAGVVRIETHVGDFCVVQSGVEGYIPALGDTRIDQCDQIGQSAVAAIEYGRQQSVAFANFINIIEQQTVDQIRFSVVSLGNTSPLINYPMLESETSAAQWNEIAAANNRISLSLLPD